MLDQALEALKTYKWGVDPKAVQGIQDTVVATHGDAAARKSAGICEPHHHIALLAIVDHAGAITNWIADEGGVRQGAVH